MKKINIAIIVSLVILTSAFTISNIWNLATDGIIVQFELPGEGTKGTISGLKTTIDFDTKNLSKSIIIASVEMKTLNSGTPKKDDHLKNADFFDVEKYPNASFASSAIKADGTGFIAEGNLTIKDKTLPVSIPFTFTEEGGKGVFKGTMTVHTGEFGVTKKSTDGKDAVIITLTVPVTK